MKLKVASALGATISKIVGYLRVNLSNCGLGHGGQYTIVIALKLKTCLHKGEVAAWDRDQLAARRPQRALGIEHQAAQQRPEKSASIHRLKYIAALALFATCLYGQIPQVDYPLGTKRKPAEDPRQYQFTRVNGSGASGNLTSAGTNTITVAPCPLYVAGADLHHPVRISGGVGTAEAPEITGGTCTSGATSGTIAVTTANTHSGAWQVTDAAGGIQEAVLAAGQYGGVNLGCQTYEIYAPVRVSYHVSLLGCGVDATYLHNNSTTTGVINYTALSFAGAKTPFGGVLFSGFTIYAGAAGNTDVDTSASDAVYVLGSDWNLHIQDVFIQNHAVGVRTINTWSSRITGGGCRFFRDYCVYTETDSEVGAGTEAGPGAGGDQKLIDLNISNVGATHAQTVTGCAVRYANWSGAYLDNVTGTATPWGLCLQPRAAHGTETFTQIYYAQVENSQFDTTAYGGILLDSTAATAGGITTVKFSNVISSFNGCLANCTGTPFANAAHGIYFHATAGKVIRDISFIGGEVRENGGHGVYTDATAYINSLSFSGMNADNNSQAATNTYDGYHFSAGNFQITVQGAMSGAINSNLTRFPRYGLYVSTAMTQAQITGNTFYPSNATAPCFVASDVVLNNISFNYPLTDSACNPSMLIPGQIGANVASAGTITPSVNAGGTFHVTGTAAIATINTPSPFAFGGTVCLIADGAWSTTLAGNIGVAFTATPGFQYCFAYDGTIASKWYPTGGGGAGGGGVTSVGMTGDNVIYGTSVTGSPVTGIGTLVPVLKTQTANTVLAGPSSAGPTAPTFRALAASDIPTIPASGVSGLPHSFTCNIGNATSSTVISTGDAGCYSDNGPYSGTINQVDILGNAASLAVCSITVDIWKANGAYPTSGNKISASAPVTLSSQNTHDSGSQAGWSNSVASGDKWNASVSSVTGCVYVQVKVFYQ